MWSHSGMPTKVIIDLPDDLHRELAREAVRRGTSEAEVIRSAIADAVRRPRPRAGIVDGEPFAERDEELLAGRGD